MAEEKKTEEEKVKNSSAKKSGSKTTGAKKTPQKSKSTSTAKKSPAKKKQPAKSGQTKASEKPKAPEKTKEAEAPKKQPVSAATEKATAENTTKETMAQAAAKEIGPGSGRKNPKYGLGAILTLGGIILVLVLLLIYMNISRISKAAIEEITSNALGVPVTIEEMLVEPRELRVTVSGLKIANPAGFEEPYALEAQQIIIEGENFSREKLVFNEMSFSGTIVYLAIKDQKSNLSELSENLAREKVPDSDPASTEGPRIVVHDLSISDARLVPSQMLIEMGAQEVNLPRISGSIGEREDGISPDRAISEVTGIILDVAAKRAIRAGIMKGLEDKASDSLADKLGIKPEAVESVKEGIRGLFE